MFYRTKGTLMTSSYGLEVVVSFGDGISANHVSALAFLGDWGLGAVGRRDVDATEGTYLVVADEVILCRFFWLTVQSQPTTHI